MSQTVSAREIKKAGGLQKWSLRQLIEHRNAQNLARSMAEKPNTMREPTEHEEQVMLFQRWAYECAGLGVPEKLLFAIPNGGLRKKAVAGKLKAEGVTAGVPDIFLAWPVAPYAGLFVELKRRKSGKVSDHQTIMVEALKKAGYAARICWGADDAYAAIVNYCHGLMQG